MRRRRPINQLLYYMNYQFVPTGNNHKKILKKNHNEAIFFFSGFRAMACEWMSAVKETILKFEQS